MHIPELCITMYMYTYNMHAYVTYCIFCLQHEFNSVHFVLTETKSSKVLQVPVRLQVCSQGLVVHVADKMKVFELMASIKEIYHISDIREVCLPSIKSAIIVTITLYRHIYNIYVMCVK